MKDVLELMKHVLELVSTEHTVPFSPPPHTHHITDKETKIGEVKQYN
jgi:hypothetical protein